MSSSFGLDSLALTKLTRFVLSSMVSSAALFAPNMTGGLSPIQQYPALSLPSWNGTLNGVNPDLRRAIESSIPPIDDIFASDASIQQYRYLTGVGAPLTSVEELANLNRSIVTIHRNESRIGAAGNGSFDLFFYDNAVDNSPGIFYVHPGALVGGSPTANEKHLLKLMENTGAKVFAPMYRLIPEYAAPAALLDVLLAVDHVQQFPSRFKFDPNNTVIYGASTGADQALMAAAALHELNSTLNLRSEPLKGIFLNYPVGYVNASQDSFQEPNPPVWFSVASYKGLLDHYLAPSKLWQQAHNAITNITFASSIKNETFKALPNITITVGQFDLLRSGGEALYAHLKRIDHPTTLDVRQGDCHICIEQFPDVPLSIEGRDKLAAQIKSAFDPVAANSTSQGASSTWSGPGHESGSKSNRTSSSNSTVSSDSSTKGTANSTASLETSSTSSTSSLANSTSSDSKTEKGTDNKGKTTSSSGSSGGGIGSSSGKNATSTGTGKH